MIDFAYGDFGDPVVVLDEEGTVVKMHVVEAFVDYF